MSTDEKVQATPAQVIFKWVQSKDAVIVTTSGKKERLEEYLAVESLREFSIIIRRLSMEKSADWRLCGGGVDVVCDSRCSRSDERRD